MSDCEIHWRVKVMDDKSIVYEVMLNGVKVGEQKPGRLADTLMQGVSSMRWQDPQMR